MDRSALNRIWLSWTHDLLYGAAEIAIGIFDPCQVKEGKCRRGNFCCDGCKHLGLKGCKVQALACKVWLCDEALTSSENAKCKMVLKAIGKMADRLNLNGYRFSKEENLIRNGVAGPKRTAPDQR